MSAQLHVVFDGRCGFCTRAVGWVRRLDRHGRVELHAWQQPDVPERFGLTPQECDASVWAVPQAGESTVIAAQRPRGGGASGSACDGPQPGAAPPDAPESGSGDLGSRIGGLGSGRGGPQATRRHAVSGARAVAAILDTALGTRCFGAFHGLPLVGRTQEAVYRWVATHRGRFPGVTPWCEEHPGQCAGDA